MRLARSQATLAAEHRANVLIVGPPGSGRQRLAAAIHYGRDKMDAGAFVPLDCSLLGADLIEAASSAIVRSAARDEDAGTATLLLHRVDELAADVQVELHDFISSRLTGWRLAATAGESLVELARRGQFHAELAATLSTIAIELPPLAERRGDIPLLAQMFLEECNAAGAAATRWIFDRGARSARRLPLAGRRGRAGRRRGRRASPRGRSRNRPARFARAAAIRRPGRRPSLSSRGGRSSWTNFSAGSNAN